MLFIMESANLFSRSGLSYATTADGLHHRATIPVEESSRD